MTEQPDNDHAPADVLRHTARVVAAHLGHNKMGADAVPQLIRTVYDTMVGLGAEPDAEAVRPDPAVPIRRSVFPDYIVCLEDGAKMKILKRYIQVRFGLTPAAYRERWGLPSDYPMVAPNYAERRSVLARQSGLGRKRVAAQPTPEAEEVLEPKQDEPSATPAPVARRTRRKAQAPAA